MSLRLHSSGTLSEGTHVFRSSTAVVAAVVGLATTAALVTPADAVVTDLRAPVSLLDTTYGPGYSPGLTADSGDDSYYPDHGDPGVDVLTNDLNLRWDARKLTGTATLHLRATRTAGIIHLDLSQAMDVSSVTVGGLDSAYTHDGNDLAVTAPVTEDQTYDVVVSYSGTPGTWASPSSRADLPRVGWHTETDGSAWTMSQPFGSATWFPTNEMVADKAMYTVHLNVADKWVGISNGTMSRTHVGTRTLTQFTNAHPMPAYLLTVAIGDYRKTTQTGPHGLPMTYWYPAGRSSLVDPLKSLPTTMSWLERQLGTYPFESVGVVLTPGSSASIGSSTMMPFGTGNYRYGNRDVREQLVRQLVQAWYGGTVSPNDWRDLWMNQGMTTYLEARYSTAMGWKPWQHWSREFNRNDAYWREVYGPPGAYAHGQFAQRNVDYCSARMLLRLRGILGTTAFDKAVRDWPQTHLDSTRNRGGYVSWLEGQTGKELSKFFDTELNDAKPTL